MDHVQIFFQDLSSLDLSPILADVNVVSIKPLKRLDTKLHLAFIHGATNTKRLYINGTSKLQFKYTVKFLFIRT